MTPLVRTRGRASNATTEGATLSTAAASRRERAVNELFASASAMNNPPTTVARYSCDLISKEDCHKAARRGISRMGRLRIVKSASAPVQGALTATAAHWLGVA